jgi:hypothetical protein
MMTIFLYLKITLQCSRHSTRKKNKTNICFNPVSEWHPNIPFVISTKCLNKNTHNKKKPAYYKWHSALLQIKPMKLCAFASEIADGLVEIKA